MICVYCQEHKAGQDAFAHQLPLITPEQMYRERVSNKHSQKASKGCGIYKPVIKGQAKIRKVNISDTRYKRCGRARP